jgi:hypothetical protein
MDSFIHIFAISSPGRNRIVAQLNHTDFTKGNHILDLFKN